MKMEGRDKQIKRLEKRSEGKDRKENVEEGDIKEKKRAGRGGSCL